MSKYNFTDAEGKFIGQFFIWHKPCKIVHWKEHGSTEWYYLFPYKPISLPSKTQASARKIIKMMIKLELLVPEIESDKEYVVQRALGCVIGRIYYMPEEICEELKNELIDL